MYDITSLFAGTVVEEEYRPQRGLDFSELFRKERNLYF